MTDLKSNNEFDSLEAFFNERLKDASFASPREPWMQIEAQLDALEKQKRKRRFLWFFTSGLILLCGLASLWFFVLNDKFESKTIAEKQSAKTVAAKNNSAEKNKKTTENRINETIPESGEVKTDATETKEQNSSNETTDQRRSVAQNNAVEQTTDVNPSATTLIQLAACGKKASAAQFNKVPFKVIEVQGDDGYVRYFAEASGNKEEALSLVRDAGFEKAFVKKNFNSADESSVVKNEGVIEAAPATYVAANTALAKARITAEPKPGSTNAVAVASVKNATETKAIKTPIANTNTKTTEPSNTNTVAVNTTPSKTENNNATPVVVNTNTVSNANTGNTNAVAPPVEDKNTSAAIAIQTKADEVKDPPGEDQHSANAVKTDSVTTPVAVNEVKSDSLPKKPEAVDSAKTTAAYATPDAFTPEWAILLLAGPNIFSQNMQSTLIKPEDQQQTPSVNAEARIQFRPFKYFSFSGGVNYNQLISNQGNPVRFFFNKKQTADYTLYSEHGSMAVPMSVLLEGYNTGVPFDTFFARYTYNSKLNVLSIPLEANLHFLNRSRFNVFAAVGANSSFVVSQQTKLTIVKENFNNEVSYHNVTVNRFNISLIFSLGCDIRLGKRMYLTLMPSYRYGLTNMSATSGTTLSPAYFAGNAGIKFKL